MFLILIIWFVSSIIVGAAASSRNRSGFGWFLISAMFSPLVGGLWLFVLPSRVGKMTRGEIIAKLQTIRDCPFCAETVKREAKICKHCHKDLPPAEPLTLTPAASADPVVIEHWTSAEAPSNLKVLVGFVAFFGVAILVLAVADSSMSTLRATTPAPAQTQVSNPCGGAKIVWARDGLNKEVYTCDNGKTWWPKR
jgi:hypothetical protein